MKIIVDCTNNTETTRELTTKEIADKAISKTNFEAKLTAQTTAQAARQAVLNKLGLTTEEVVALLG